MYKVKIITIYNEINLEVEKIDDPWFLEVLKQPYIISVEILDNQLTLTKKNDKF